MAVFMGSPYSGLVVCSVVEFGECGSGRRCIRTCRARPGPGGVAAEQMYMPGTPDAVGRQRDSRAEGELADVFGAGHDVAADEIGVVGGHLRR